jgi:hypothetical protein
MAMSQELLKFVKEGLAHGMSREAITDVLKRAGWPPTQIVEALRGFADVESPIPVPRPLPYVSAREVFTYVVLFVTLYLTAYNLGSLLFDLIDTAFPDSSRFDNSEYVSRSIRWSVSSLVVAFPIFLVVARHVSNSVKADPSKRLSRIRRQLTYVTLFVASCILIGDATTLIYNLLGGELTTRFVLKVLVLAAIAGAAFAYSLSDVRAVDRELAA